MLADSSPMLSVNVSACGATKFVPIPMVRSESVNPKSNISKGEELNLFLPSTNISILFFPGLLSRQAEMWCHFPRLTVTLPVALVEPDVASKTTSECVELAVAVGSVYRVIPLLFLIF